MTPRSAEEWAGAASRWLGIFGLVFCAVFWAFTNRVEPVLVTGFGGLLAIGHGAEAIAALKRTPPEPPQVGSSQEHREE